MDKYKRYEKYNVVCGLEGHNQFCKKHKGAPCCFFFVGTKAIVRMPAKMIRLYAEEHFARAKKKTAENCHSQTVKRKSI